MVNACMPPFFLLQPPFLELCYRQLGATFALAPPQGDPQSKKGHLQRPGSPLLLQFLCQLPSSLCRLKRPGLLITEKTLSQLALPCPPPPPPTPEGPAAAFLFIIGPTSGWLLIGYSCLWMDCHSPGLSRLAPPGPPPFFRGTKADRGRARNTEICR